MDRRDMMKLAALGTGAMMLPPQLKAMLLDGTIKASDFGPDFLWGVAAAAYQIEGAWNVDGKGPSIWDTYTHTKGKIHNGDNGDVACDFYNRYPQDIELIKSLGVDVFRFSLSWPRILPTGRGAVNEKGLEFYDRVIDKCLEEGLEPWVTLFHWDLPQAIQDVGGWENREVVGWFTEYVDICTRRYGDRVKNWMILNEPMAFTAVGHLLGMHAPGKKSVKAFLKASHHATLCQAEGGRVARANVSGGNIGSTFSCSYVDVKSDKKRHHNAQRKVDVLINRLFIEPALGMGYPIDDLGFLKKIEKYMEPGDEDKMAFDFDFIGLQNYTRVIAQFALWPPVVWANQVKPHKIEGAELTEMKWEVYPEGIYKILKQFSEYEGIKRIIVTENGAAFPDTLTADGRVHDEKRVTFFKNYLANVLKAKKDGVPVDGYFIWTFMDNFEWAEGYDPRFGIVHVDFETQERRMKDSALWYQEFLTR